MDKKGENGRLGSMKSAGKDVKTHVSQSKSPKIIENNLHFKNYSHNNI